MIINKPYRVCYFNPRPRKEGDPARSERRVLGVYFNPRPRKEGDRSKCKLLLYLQDFNPRPRKEGDQYHRQEIVSAMPFQSTPS